MKLVNFFDAIEQLGATNSERAAFLGMTDRRLENWKSGDTPRLLRILVNQPRLLEALIADAREVTKETSQAS